jgi:serine/threonine protein phosphatase PrpC
MITYGSSIKGRRDNNQDSFLIYAPNSQTIFLAVADGIGGNVGGKIASNLVIDTSRKIITESFAAGLNQLHLKPIMVKIYSEAKKAIDAKINEEPKLNKMGTTLSCVLVHNDCYVWGNIGDSRIYHFANREFYQITNDHSFIEKLALFEEEKSSNSIMENFGHIVTRSLCGEKDEPDIFPKHAPCEKLNNGEGF